MMSKDRNNLDWLFACQRFGIVPGLTRVRDLLARLGNPQQHFETVLVAGTNGKGSTAATLASIVHAGGRRVGLFTSPHLTHFAERFVVNGQQLPAALVADALARVRPAAEAAQASFFESVTALGCLLFAGAGVEVAVMEVGLGGRLDATNALEPVLSVITSIGLDHTAILGDSHAAIAAEKAGILRPDLPAVTGVAPDLWPVLDSAGADLWALGREFNTEVRSLGWAGNEVQLRGRVNLEIQTPLLGLHGAHNAALGAVAALRLGTAAEAVIRGAALTRWPGRMEVLPSGAGKILLDGAHNPDGARALAATLEALKVGRVPLIFGATEDKDIQAVAQFLAPHASRVVLTRAALGPRAADPAALAGYFPGLDITLTRTPAEALAAVRGEPLALACGSLYLIGELRPLVLGEGSEGRERWQ